MESPSVANPGITLAPPKFQRRAVGRPAFATVAYQGSKGGSLNPHDNNKNVTTLMGIRGDRSNGATRRLNPHAISVSVALISCSYYYRRQALSSNFERVFYGTAAGSSPAGRSSGKLFSFYCAMAALPEPSQNLSV